MISLFEGFTEQNIKGIVFNFFMTEVLSYRNHSIDLQDRLRDWFLYDRDLRYERVKDVFFGNTALKQTQITRNQQILQQDLKL